MFLRNTCQAGGCTPAQLVEPNLLFWVCESALPATAFEFLLYRPSFKIFDAVDATFLLVCFLFGISITPFFNNDLRFLCHLGRSNFVVVFVVLPLLTVVLT
jgi:hypothetical protein